MQTFDLQTFVARFREVAEGYPATFLDVVDMLPDTNIGTGPWLCGGAVRRLIDGSTTEGDYDIFFRDERQLNSYCQALRDMADSGDIEIVSQSGRDTNLTIVIKYRDREITVQLIKFYFDGLRSIMEWFDFTICQCVAANNDDGTLILNLGDFAAFDIARKRLVVNNLHHAVSSVRRVFKYGNQGYTACGGVIADILTRVAADPTIINEEVISVD